MKNCNNNCQPSLNGHYIWSETYAAWSNENDNLIGTRTEWPVTAYQHYRLLEDGCINSDGKWLWGHPDLVQLEYQLEEYDKQGPAEEDVDLATFIARTVVEHPKSGKARTVALLAVLAERLKERISKKWLNKYIHQMLDRKGVLQVQVSDDCPWVVVKEIENIWEEVFFEPLCEFEGLDQSNNEDIWN